MVRHHKALRHWSVCTPSSDKNYRPQSSIYRPLGIRLKHFDTWHVIGVDRSLAGPDLAETYSGSAKVAICAMLQWSACVPLESLAMLVLAPVFCVAADPGI